MGACLNSPFCPGERRLERALTVEGMKGCRRMSADTSARWTFAVASRVTLT